MLSHEDREEIKELITETVKTCQTCKLIPDAQEAHELDLFLTQIQNLGGDGKLSTSAEIIRDNHRWLYRQRMRGERLNVVVYTIVISALITGLLSALWIGFKRLVHAE